MRKMIGKCGVDSGQIMITDPCYVIDGEFTEKHYQQVCEITLADGHAGSLPYDLGHEGKAVVSSSGIGDGLYPVYATYEEVDGWGERIMKLEIDFSEHVFLMEDIEDDEVVEEN